MRWERGIFVAVLVIAGACENASSSRVDQAIGEPSCSETLVAWGAGDGQLGATPAGDEIAARGPQAAAIGPHGQVLVLDSVNGRLVELKGSVVVPIASVPVDADDLAIGPDGAIAVLSSTSRLVRIYNPDGALAGEVAVPATVRSITGIRLGDSREVLLRTALQETIPLGSPAAPRSLESSLVGTREGAFTVADGRGLSVRVEKRSARLWLSATTREEATGRASESHALPGIVDGANLIGFADGIACVRLEEVAQPSEALEVSRRAVCLEASSGKVVFERALAPPALQQPRQELALGGSPLQLLSLSPRADGMLVESCEVPR